MIREDGTSTIKITKPVEGCCTGTDENHPTLSVSIKPGEVVIRSDGFAFTMPETVAWQLRDLLTRTLDESCAPART